MGTLGLGYLCFVMCFRVPLVGFMVGVMLVFGVVSLMGIVIDVLWLLVFGFAIWRGCFLVLWFVRLFG